MYVVYIVYHNINDIIHIVPYRDETHVYAQGLQMGVLSGSHDSINSKAEDPTSFLEDPSSTTCSRRMLHLPQTAVKCLSSYCPSYLFKLFSAWSLFCLPHAILFCNQDLPATRSSFGEKAFSFIGASIRRSLSESSKTFQPSLYSVKTFSTDSLLFACVCSVNNPFCFEYFMA